MQKAPQTDRLDFLRSKWEMVRRDPISFVAYLSGSCLFFTGLTEIFCAFSPSQSLNTADPILGILFRYLMLAAGIIQLVIASILLFTKNYKWGFGLTGWFAVNYLAYRVGLWNLGWHHTLGFTAPVLVVSPPVADAIISTLTLFPLLAIIGVYWRQRRIVMAASFHKMFCPACGGHVKFAVQNLGAQIPCPHCAKTLTLRQPDAMIKSNCFFCQGHLEFPAHALGTKMHCPHCNMDITLKEQA